MRAWSSQNPSDGRNPIVILTRGFGITIQDELTIAVELPITTYQTIDWIQLMIKAKLFLMETLDPSF